MGRRTWDLGRRTWGRGDVGTRGRGDSGTRGLRDSGTWGRGDVGTRPYVGTSELGDAWGFEDVINKQNLTFALNWQNTFFEGQM